jgi:tetratricopeptide (TPR) repeat protein
LINKGDLLWNLENQKQDSEQRELAQKIISESQIEYNASKQAFYNQLRILGAKENIIAAIEKAGGPEKVKGSYWDMVINKLNNDDKVKVVDLLLKCVNNCAQLKRKLNDTLVKVDHTESYKLYNQAIKKAKKEIQKDFDEYKKAHEEHIYQNMLESLKKSEEEIYNNQLLRLAQQHASDAYEIGYMYWMMEDNKNAVEWLEKSKKMNPDSTQQVDKILSKIHSSTEK